MVAIQHRRRLGSTLYLRLEQHMQWLIGGVVTGGRIEFFNDLMPFGVIEQRPIGQRPGGGGEHLLGQVFEPPQVRGDLLGVEQPRVVVELQERFGLGLIVPQVDGQRITLIAAVPGAQRATRRPQVDIAGVLFDRQHQFKQVAGMSGPCA
ncbi:hypothetical protein LOY66_15570 [Pseudomonas viciae]|nr:hypothetical protein [Pseudomonas viciae]UZE84053.1 hypothetical protein LOY66_15570 [Pseudomonas viciae]